jgi:periplasmic protein TonB
MDEPPLFRQQIISRPRSGYAEPRRMVAIGSAALLHLLALVTPVLMPLFVIELIEPPRAVVTEIESPPIFYPPHGSRHDDPRPPASIRRGGGPTSSPAAAPQSQALRPDPTPEPAPRTIPIATPPPAPAPAAWSDRDAADLAAAVSPGAPPGPGDPNGTGSANDGTLQGCDGCQGGGGPGGPGADQRIYESDPRITPPVPIASRRALPKYPEMARRVGQQGTVILLVAIRTDGTVGEIEVIRSPDARFGFDLAAIEAVKQWRYRPGLLNGRAVTVFIQVMVEFTLSR